MLSGSAAFSGFTVDDVPTAKAFYVDVTILNFPVDDIDAAVDQLTERGVEFARYDGLPQDDKGILRGLANNLGPDIAWFTDPAGNIFAVLQQN